MAKITFGIPANPIFQTVTITGTGLTVAAASGNTNLNMTIPTTADVDLQTMRDQSGSRMVEFLWLGTTHAMAYGMPGGTGGINSQTDFYFSLVDGVVGSFKATTGWQFAPKIRTSGSSSYLNYSSPADTGLTANTECLGVNYALGQTRTWADGTVAVQREVVFQAPTYAKTTTSATFTKAATVAITNAPQAAAGVTITNPYAFWVQAGATQLDGNTAVTGNLSATSASSSTASLIRSAVAGATAANNAVFSAYLTGLVEWQFGAVSTDSSFRLSSNSLGTGDVLKFANTGAVTFSAAARSSGVASYYTMSTPADTGITASTESIGENHVTAIRTWATTGTVALQRERFFAGPTYASASASQTFTDAFNVYMTPPVQGTNAIFTRGHTLGIVDATSAVSSITGGLIVATTLGTAATSVGIGGGNINAGGSITAGGAYTSGAPTTGTAGAWKLGILVTTASTVDTTKYIQLDVGGTLYKLATMT